MKKIFLIFFGILLAICFLEFCFHIVSLTIDFNKNHKSKEQFKNNQNINVVCIGESLTADQYTKYLEQDLEEKGITNVKVIDEGVGGINSDYIIDNVLNQVIEKDKPDIIVSMMGLMDESKDYRKIKALPVKSKILSLFYFYKFFNTNIKQNKQKIEEPDNSTINIHVDIELDKKYQKALAYYNNKEYDKAIEILKELDFESHIQKNVEHSMIDALKLSGKTKEVQDYVLKKLDKDIMFNLGQTIIIALETDNAEILKKVFNLKNKELFKKVVINSLQYVYILKECMKRFELYEELDELNKILNNIDNKDIVFEDKRLNPYTEKAIYNYRKLVETCKQKNIKLIIMSYPTLPVFPYKLFFKDFDNITYVSNQENFEKALKEKLYFDIFRDSFAGNFGHCTDFGNKLISKNLANTIEKMIK